MIGQKFINLLSDLNTSERKLLIYKGKQSKDKRLKQMVYLLGNKGQSVYDFQELLNEIKSQLSTKGQSEKTKNDLLRRFVDFCMKEIEDLKIENYTKSNSSMRNYILSKVYNKSDTLYLYQDYLSKLNTCIKNSNEFWIKNYCVEKMADMRLLSQTDEDFKKWRGLLSTQINLIQNHYQDELASIYTKIASSHVDDRTTLDQFNAKYLSEDFILKQIDLVINECAKANLYLALARFNFENEIKYPLYSSEAIKIIKKNNSDDAELVRRRVYFASFLHAFHFNHSYSVIKKLLLKIIAFNLKINVKEPKIYFYLFVMQIIQDDNDGEINFYNENSKKYFSNEEFKYFHQFLVALNYFKNKDFKSAKRILSNLSFTNNPYIASWSRCLEITANYKQGDLELTETLINKEIKRLTNYTNRIFTINSSMYFLVKMTKLLKIKVSKTFTDVYSSTNNISPLHHFIINSLEKE